MNVNIKNWLLRAATFLLLVACIDDDFDTPTAVPIPDSNSSIQEIKDSYQGDTIFFTTEVIRGKVISSDEQGNFFENLFIQDETGGLVVRADVADLYTDYPRGSEVVVELNGLFMTDFAGLIQIDGITETNVKLHIFRSAVDVPVTPEVVTIGQFSDDKIGTLIQLEDVEFQDSNDTYAVEDGGSGRNRLIKDCFGNTVIMRNSDFADFAGVPVPMGNGSLSAVLSTFNGSYQILISEPMDLSFINDRCGGGMGGDCGDDIPPNGPNAGALTIADLRAAYTGSDVTAPSGTINAVVISDNSNGNINSLNVVVQDNTAGIVLRFSDDHNLLVNEHISVDVSGALLTEFSSLLQAEGIPPSAITRTGTFDAPTPRVATVNCILSNGDLWESTIVRIENSLITGSSTFGGSTTVSDATGSIQMFTRSGASFANNAVPSMPFTLTAIVSDFDGTQLNMRNAQDAGGSGGGPGGDSDPITAAELRSAFNGGATTVPQDRKLTATVISDFQNGNTNAQNAVVQDASGGIVLRFDAQHALALNEEVTIEIGGQELAEFNGLLQVNNISLSAATSNGQGAPISPRVTTVSEAMTNFDAWESTLLQFTDVGLTGNTVFAGTLTLSDASGSIDMFTFNGASFANDPIPNPPLTITAILSEFNAPQVIMRNSSDFNGGGMGGDPDLKDLIEIRDNFNNGATTVSANTKVRGVVISDVGSGNLTDRNLFLQDGSGGIVVRFADVHAIPLNELIEIEVGGEELSEFRGLLQINNVPNSAVTQMGPTPDPIVPNELTITEIAADFDNLESTLVKILNVTITGAATFDGGTTVTDGTGSIDMFTRTDANFSGNALPSGMVNLTCVVSEFDAIQVVMRNASDVE